DKTSLVVDKTLGQEATIFDFSNGETDRKLTGLANGEVKAGSTDAINGSQLYESMMGTYGQFRTNGGLGIDFSSAFTGVNDGTITSVYQGFDNLDKRIVDLNKSVGEINDKMESVAPGEGGITNGESGVIKVDQGKIIIDDNLAEGADFNIVKEDGTGRKLTGLADGKVAESSNDAVNGGQLYDANTAIANLLGGGVEIDSSGYVKYNTNGNNFTVGGKGYNSVAEAIQAIDQTTQMFGTGEAIIYDKDGNESTIGAITINGNDQAGAISFAKTDGASRKVTGVADGYIGAGSTEAVNGGQIYEMSQSITQANQEIKNINYTLNHYNTRMNNIEKKVHENRKVASAGIAGAMAMSSIPYIDYSKYSFGMGIGYYDGESAMSMGIQGRINERAKYRVQFSYDTQNKAGVGAGIAFEL
ncbi:YadA-like family protein, partial [Ignatzschineria indica]|uniref:YadA-like family protein n=1 Tax=Ignatzschineria indica TaxID=472583 RepID=UPI002577E9B3